MSQLPPPTEAELLAKVKQKYRFSKSKRIIYATLQQVSRSKNIRALRDQYKYIIQLEIPCE